MCHKAQTSPYSLKHSKTRFDKLERRIAENSVT